MNKMLRSAVLVGVLLAGASSAHAAVRNYAFTGAFDSGVLSGTAFDGGFSFDDAGLVGSGSEWLALDSLNLHLLGASYGLADGDAMAEAGFQDGQFLGISYSVSSGEPAFAFVAGTFDSSDAFVAYDSSLGLSGAGGVIYAAVPEPEAYAMLLAGLGLLGSVARRRARAQ